MTYCSGQNVATQDNDTCQLHQEWPKQAINLRYQSTHIQPRGESPVVRPELTFNPKGESLGPCPEFTFNPEGEDLGPLPFLDIHNYQTSPHLRWTQLSRPAPQNTLERSRDESRWRIYARRDTPRIYAKPQWNLSKLYQSTMKQQSHCNKTYIFLHNDSIILRINHTE